MTSMTLERSLADDSRCGNSRQSNQLRDEYLLVMKITVNQLKHIIKEEVSRVMREAMKKNPNAIDTFERFDELAPGDEITINGAPRIVVSFDRDLMKLNFVSPTNMKIRKSIDVRLALPEEPGDVPEYEVEFVKKGSEEDSSSLVKRPPNPPKKRVKPSFYD